MRTRGWPGQTYRPAGPNRRQRSPRRHLVSAQRNVYLVPYARPARTERLQAARERSAAEPDFRRLHGGHRLGEDQSLQPRHPRSRDDGDFDRHGSRRANHHARRMGGAGSRRLDGERRAMALRIVARPCAVVVGILGPQPYSPPRPRRRLGSGGHGRPAKRVAALPRRLLWPRALPGEIQRRPFHRRLGTQERGVRCRLSPLGRRLLVSEHPPDLLGAARQRRLRAHASLVPDVSRHVAAGRAPHAGVVWPRRGVLPRDALLLGHAPAVKLRLGPHRQGHR